MCGITGFWQAAPIRGRDENTIDAMVRVLHHRGPDGHGVHLDREAGLAMAHTRLAIIDLDTGEQPLRTRDGSLVLTTNGEFYDYKRIRTALQCEGVRFTSKSDAEIALHLHAKHGLDFVHHLRGEFAFTLYDVEAQRLVMVRDRFGIKPLYYRVDGGLLVWGSELKAVLEHPRVTAKIDARSARHQMMQTMVPGRTTFEGIECVLPGEMLIFTREGDGFSVKRERYWDAEFPEDGHHRDETDEQGHILGVRNRLLDAVAVRLEADVPVGCYLSGGIDSCSILGLASSLQQSPVKAFTIGFDDPRFDETHIAREMAIRADAEQDVIRLGADELYGAAFERTVWHAERTFYNTLGVAKLHMSKHVRSCGYKTVVTGEGSDELFAGYPMFKRDYVLHGSDAEARHAALGEIERSNAVVKGAILAEVHAEHPAMNALIGFTPSWIQPWIVTLRLVRPLMAKEHREALAHYDPISEIAGALDASKIHGRHPLDRAQYSWIKTMLEGQILTWGGDRVDMANSMESRPAFLDHHLAEYAFTLPPGHRIKAGVEKWVLREAMKHVLPQALYERQKFAFMAPPSHAGARKKSAAGALVERHLGRDQLEDAGLFDPEAVLGFLRGQGVDAAASFRRDIILNHLLCLQILHHQFVRGALPPDVA